MAAAMAIYVCMDGPEIHLSNITLLIIMVRGHPPADSQPERSPVTVVHTTCTEPCDRTHLVLTGTIVPFISTGVFARQSDPQALSHLRITLLHGQAKAGTWEAAGRTK